MPSSTPSVPKKLVVANWKMNLTTADARSFFTTFLPLEKSSSLASLADIVICPSFVSLADCARLIKEASAALSLGAQDLFWEAAGAYTGETSAAMVKEFAQFVIIGHSERRMHRNETDQIIAAKMKLALAQELNPLLCVGEPLDVYEAKESQIYVEQQLRESLKGVTYWPDQQIIVAYEPIWALSSTEKRHDADPEYIQETSAFIRQIIAQLYNEKSSQEARILYGGNVVPEQVREFTSLEDVNGVLVGSASTKPDTFAQIISNIK